MDQQHWTYVTLMILMIFVSICRTVEDDQPTIYELANKWIRFWKNTDESESDIKRANYDKSRPRYNPGLAMIGLGKRKNEKPKYNPGWEFIGLGKRNMDQLELKEGDNLSSSNLDMQYDRYFSLLNLNNISKFFDHLKRKLEEIKKPDYKTDEELAIIGLKPSEDYDKKSSKQKYWKDNLRPVYNPNWEITGPRKK
ncbi:uncharacterized protein LOC111640959 [Centruroides sculpturatus]|uniref:uncharacterized protein LOC111640959 n=1 Tax=Centruroides sculpturatus TaxID=218467 RepID=UPI000C6DE04C|nr:uncharacterized protein LOC111640959 [Centruroides sculpturatus]